MQTEEYRFKTEPSKVRDSEIGGIELVLSRTPNGAWKLACAQLWSNGESRVIAASDTPVEGAQLAALSVANERMMELSRSLFSSASRALGRTV